MTVADEPAGNKGSLLNPRDLRNFDEQATDLVLRAQMYGWRGHITERGHAFMYAPDGVHTMSISRDSLRGRSGKNSKAQLDRWLKARERQERQEQEINAFGMTADQIEHKDVGLPLQPNGEPYPLSVVASLLRSDKAHALWESRGRRWGEDTVIIWIGPHGDDEQMAWFVIDTLVTPPVLVDHDPAMSESDVWHVVAESYPEVFGKTEPVVEDDENDVEVGDVKVFMCPEPGCDKQFERSGALNLHRSSAHPQELLCPQCGRAVKGNGGLGSHMRIHRDEVKPAASTGAAALLKDIDVDDAQAVVGQIRALVAAPLVAQIEELRAENARLTEENEKLTAQAGDWEARYDLIREALGV